VAQLDISLLLATYVASRWRQGSGSLGVLSVDPFFNINEPRDLARAEALLQEGAG
jgi:molybdopterin-guanine dinucleotide biosynthesis protein A